MELIKEFGNGLGQQWGYIPKKYVHDLGLFLRKELKDVFQRQMKHLMNRTGNAYKYHFEVKVEFSKLVVKLNDLGVELNEYERRTTDPWFTTSTCRIYYLKEIPDLWENNIKEIDAKFDAFIHQGSGWVFERVIEMRLTTAEFVPFSGGHQEHPLLPRAIKMKRACLHTSTCNTRDDKCFLYCIAAHFQRHKGLRMKNNFSFNLWERRTHFDLSNLSFPTPIGQISEFEKRNHLSINVYRWIGNDHDKKKMRRYVPLQVLHLSKSKLTPKSRCIDLLYHKNHYYLITNLSRLISSSLGSYLRHNKTFVCRSCLSILSSKTKLEAHKKYCLNDGQVYVFPEEPELKFKNYRAMIPSRHVIYYDFECILEPVESHVTHSTRVRHVPIAISAKRVCLNSNLNSSLFTYVGHDCVNVFLEWLREQIDQVNIIDLHFTESKYRMNQSDWTRFHAQKECEMCGCALTLFTGKCFDHCHLRPDKGLRYVLCNRCNLTYAAERDINIACVAHNASRYDQHLFIEELAKQNATSSKFRILPKNTEHYLAVYADSLTFIDSILFLSSSLSKLVEAMKSHTSTVGTDTVGAGIAFPLLHEYVRGNSEQYDLLLRKGVFCYDYLSAISRLDENCLPPPSEFYDSLKKCPISEGDYQHAQRVWETMHCTCLKDYLTIYLQTDVLLLADCFEKFRSMALKHFQLDPAKFISTPHLSFHAMLKFTGVKLHLIDNLEMYLFIKRGIRGGVASIMHRCVDDVNIPELESGFRPDLPRKEILPLDATNLYGYALSRSLPVGNFRWIDVDDTQEVIALISNEDETTGYILEADLSYPLSLHDLHSEYPLAPEKITIGPTDWSPYMHQLAAKFMDSTEIKSDAPKLIPHLGPRWNYIVYSKNLLFYLKLGMKLEKVHRILAFDQAKWMKSFIDFNTEQRKHANTVFESDFWKLVSNSTYGKTLQDNTKHMSMTLVTGENQFLKKTSQPNFKSLTIYNKSLAGVQMKPKRVNIHQPIAVGMVCLEISKLHMYKMHYNFIKPLYGDACRLLMTDTDSLVYVVTDRNTNEDMRRHRRYFDMSNYAENSPYFSAKNKKVRGTFKREYASDPIVKFIGLRAKMYCTKHLSDMTVRKAKGIPTSATRLIDYEDYEAVLKGQPTTASRCAFKAIRSQKHNIFTLEQEKKALSSMDTKRYICEDGINTLAFGHYKTNAKELFNS